MLKREGRVNSFVTSAILIAAAIVILFIFFNPNRLPTYRLANDDIIQSAYAKFVKNTDWMPTEREFDGVMMVLVPAGCFEMGSNTGDDNEQPAHTQCIETPFWFDKTEVTQTQFVTQGGVKNTPNFFRFKADNQPVENITWFEAQAYCEKRGGRLPTEKEWEYAARGPNGSTYPWGNEYVADYYQGKSNYETADVGSKPYDKSWVGALDMSGNVSEWTSSLYKDYPYISDDGREDLTGSSSYVTRGGSWWSVSKFSRALNRDYLSPRLDLHFLGFRCMHSQ